MSKEEILQRVMNDVAHDMFGLKFDWIEEKEHIILMWPEIANRYAIAMCNEQKKVCLEAAQVETYIDGEIITGRPLDIKGQVVTINRQSILNAKNVGE